MRFLRPCRDILQPEHLFVAEAPGISPDKLKPRIRETAIRLWLIYVILTVSELVLLKLGGMSFYDAINHSLTTMATGNNVKQLERILKDGKR